MYDQALAWAVARVQPERGQLLLGHARVTGAPKVQAGLQAAARAGVTVVAATGDTGATEPDGTSLSPASIALWPASDPLVTAVGGTWLHTDAAGNRLRPDTAFSDAGGSFAGGAACPRSSLAPPGRTVSAASWAGTAGSLM